MPEKNPEVKLSEELLTEYSSIRSKWARQATQDNEFRNGVQWTKEQVNSLRKRAQEPLVVNVVYPAVEQAKAMLTANSPRFQSTGREGSDVKTGQIFSDLMSWVWENFKGNTELKWLTIITSKVWDVLWSTMIPKLILAKAMCSFRRLIHLMYI